MIAEKYDLHANALMQTEVTGTDWDEDSGRWLVKTDRGDAIKARFVVHSNGPLNRPKLPAISGITSFRAHVHTSRWDYGYTGGNSDGDLDKLKDKRVAVIGTGATAVQCVPHLGASAAELYVFQRTPSSIDLRNNQPTDPDWLASQKPGWHEARRRNFESLLAGVPVKQDLVNDGWTEAFRLLFGTVRDKAPSKLSLLIGHCWLWVTRFLPQGREKISDRKSHAAHAFEEEMELADFRKMESIRAGRPAG